MSFNRENVIWQSEDGNYYRGFFTVTWVGSEADGYDPEWDVEYDMSSFDIVSGPVVPQDDALKIWLRVNPGHHFFVPYRKDTNEETKKYDRMFVDAQKTQRNTHLWF